jgi:tetratricopeptide (TPR) repeat protein
MRKIVPSVVMILASVTHAPAISAQHDHGAPSSGSLGSVHFSTSCDPVVQPEFDRAVALLHSFWYKKSAETFAAIVKADPNCGMAEWGIAMTHYRQLWDPPASKDLEDGWAAVARAKSAAVKTQRERDYIAAIEIFYKDYATRTHALRALDYEHAVQGVYEHYPQDSEAAIFYALSVRANAPASDKTYTNQKKASAILEKLFVEHPEHPGLAHYIIHCDDYPALAPRALDAARRYAKIAPEAPHALHMPSHIFTRLGLWQESIDSNLASAAAAKKNGLAGDEFHALDYLAYAYLQRGQDREAHQVLENLPKLDPQDAAYYTALFASASIPSRLAIEQHHWSEAAGLPLPAGSLPNGHYAWTRADLYFARAIGAARMGNVDGARSELERMTALRDQLLGEHDKYSAEQVDIQRETVNAWIAFAEGNKDDALHQMQAAAVHEDATDKSPVTPGAIAPARELLGEMFLESNKSAPALDAFETALQTTPERFNSLYGAARAAQLAGEREKAGFYYAKLLANCEPSGSERTELTEAKLFLGAKK